MSGRLCAGVGYFMGSSRGHLSGLFRVGGVCLGGLPSSAPEGLFLGHPDICHCTKL